MERYKIKEVTSFIKQICSLVMRDEGVAYGRALINAWEIGRQLFLESGGVET